MSVELTNILQNAHSVLNRPFANNEKPEVVREDNNKNQSNTPDGKPVIYSDNLSSASKAELNIIQREIPNPNSKQASNAYEIVARNVPDYSEEDKVVILPKEQKVEPGTVKTDDGEVKPVYAKAADDIAKEAEQRKESAAEERAETERRVKDILENRRRTGLY